VTHRSRLLAVVVGLLLALPLAEVLARLVEGPSVAVELRDLYGTGDADAMLVGVEDGRVYAGRPGWSNDEVALDSRGLRRGEAVGGDCSVVLLGDSVAFGWGLRVGEGIAAQTEARLDATVWPVAAPGWNSVQEAAALELLGDALSPDVVVVLWVPNDVSSLEVDRDGAMYVQTVVPGVFGRSPEQVRPAWERSALARAGLRAARGLGWTDGELILEAAEHDAALAEVAAWAKERGVPAVLAQMPPLWDYSGWDEPWVAGRASTPYSREAGWRSAAGVVGFARLDLTSAIAPLRPSSLALAAGDRVHPNGAGAARVAERLAAAIEAAGACRRR